MCLTCLRSGVYCQQCQQKLNDGEITSLDLDIANALVNLEHRIATIKNITYKRAIEIGNMVIIQISKKSLNQIADQKTMITTALEKAIKKKVKILQKTSKPKYLAEELLAPARVKGVNKIWLPDGTSETIIRLNADDQEKLPAACSQLQNTMQELLGGFVRINFE